MAAPTPNGSSLPLPPFPEDLPTHPLLVIDYAKIKANDPAEVDKLWQAVTKLGFWYLKNHGSDTEVSQMFDMGAETLNLPLEEKLKYEQGDSGMSAGYKAKGATVVDSAGNTDHTEFLNIASDDVVSYPAVKIRTYPSTVNARMESTIIPFVRKSIEVNKTLLGVFEKKLGLRPGRLEELHFNGELSGSEARVTKAKVAREESTEKKEASEANTLRVTLQPHTDFGSLSFLHNRLGGLQVLVPGTQDWQHIKPIPGHAICNVGDALSIFSGGIMRSNMHRVVTPPGDQATCDRWSLVYFTRPTDAVILRAFVEESDVIAQAVNQAGSTEKTKYNTGSTAQAWFTRRIKYTRINNRTGPESWNAGRGTEHTITV